MPYDFDGTVPQYLTGGTFTSSYPWSACVWVRVGSYGSFGSGSGTIISAYKGGAALPFLRVSTSGQIEFWVDWDSGIGGWNGPASDVPAGTWTCIAASYAGTATSDDPVLYKMVAGTHTTLQSVTPTENNTPSGSAMATSGSSLYIGQRGDGQRAFDGEIAFLQVWHRALSFGELCQAAVRPGTVRTNLQFYRPLMGSLLDWGGNTLSLSATGASSVSSGPPVVLDSGWSNSWAGVAAAGGGGGALPLFMRHYEG